jgi:hypothetical protein
MSLTQANIKNKNLTKYIVLLGILNAIDAFMTYFWVSNGLAEEANPIMAWLINLHISLFVVGKIAIVSFFSLFLLYIKNNTQLKTRLLYFVLVAYFLVCCLHTFYFLFSE